MNLFKITEIIVIENNDDTVFILEEQILFKHFDPHYESFVINEIKDELNNFSIYSAYDFSGPPINVTKMENGKKMLRLKEFY